MNKKGFDHRAGRRPQCYPAGSNQCMVKEEGHHGMSVSSAEHYVTKSQCGSKFPYGDAKFKFGCVSLRKPFEKDSIILNSEFLLITVHATVIKLKDICLIPLRNMSNFLLKGY